MKNLIVLAFLLPLTANAQSIPKGVNVIAVKNVGFIEACNALLDSGYTIDKKDNELQTVKTEKKQYPRLWNATYIINIRVKDSVALISGTLTAPPGGGSFFDEPISNITNKKGVTLHKSLFGYIFLLLNDFALSFKREVTYLKQ